MNHKIKVTPSAATVKLRDIKPGEYAICKGQVVLGVFGGDRWIILESNSGNCYNEFAAYFECTRIQPGTAINITVGDIFPY